MVEAATPIIVPSAFDYSLPTSTVRSYHRDPEVLVTIPVHNEAPRLLDSTVRLKEYLDNSKIHYRLSIAEDGSTDGTRSLFGSLRRAVPEVIISSKQSRLGRGSALKQFWSNHDADIYAFCDADLAAHPSYLATAIRLVRQGQDIVVGSRYAPGAKVHRPPLRRLVSQGYNWLVRSVFDEKIQDHQCGLKVFSRSAISRLLPLTGADSWFWDTEVLVVASALGFAIRELPVEWWERKTRRTPLLRLASDILLHGSGLLALKGDLAQRLGTRPSPTFVQASDGVSMWNATTEPMGLER